ncbi:MAG: T9SS type A sorting domain-containing protein [Bacteroidia bacterium]|nr:T9SS type A sorting domain-containing protein [Bacteroidia bacterium]
MKTPKYRPMYSFLSRIVLPVFFALCIPQLGKAAEPTTPASLLTVVVSNCNEVDLSWVNGDGFRRMVVGSVGAPISNFPVDGTSYIAGSIFGSGTHLGSNNYVIYSSFGNSVTVTALNANKTYYFAVFEYNGTGSGTDYLTSIYPEEDTIPFGVAIDIVASDTVLCSGSSVTLDASGAVTYSWSPASGLSATTGPSVIASPSATTRYSVLGTDGSGCQAYERITLTVNPRPTVNLSAQPSVCIDDSPFMLSGGSPSGGEYSGPGVTNGEFDPSDAGTGFHTITYTYTNVQGCASTAARSLTVHSLPGVTLSSFSGRCFNATDLTLTGGNPGGGTYSGAGVTAGSFDPSDAGVGTHSITYSYTDGNGCSNAASSPITVFAIPIVTLSNFGIVCIDSATFALSGGSPAGGVYTGTGVSAGMFNPSVAGVGTHTITYRVTNAQGCSDSTSEALQVAGLPSVTASPFNSVCVGASPFLLSGGSPSGGTFSGTGVSSNMFSAAVADTGVHNIYYSYTNSNGCVNTDTTSIEVTPGPIVTLGTFPDRCANSGPVTLNTGSPAGGVYSGVAVSGSTFFTGIAGAGTHAIIYTYIDSTSCAGLDTQNIIVRPVPVVSLGPDTTMCQDVSILLNAGFGFTTYSWNTGANSQIISVDTTGRGTGTFAFRVSVTNIYGCVGKDTINVLIDICSDVDPIAEKISRIEVYPNPFSGSLLLDAEDEISVYIFDQTGRLLEFVNDVRGTIRLGEKLSAGVYHAQIRKDKFSKTIMLIKTD